MLSIKALPFNMFEVNTYVVWDPSTRDAAIIDPGMVFPGETDKLDDFVASKSLNVTQIINTHMHVDHIFGVPYVRENYDVKLKASSADNFLGEQAPAQARMFRLPIEASPVTADINLSDGDRIAIGTEEGIALAIPGHSPGSLALYFPESKFVITGDVLFHGSIGRTDLVGGNHSQLIDGIRRKLLTLPHDTVVYPGHGPSTTIGAELRSNPYLR